MMITPLACGPADPEKILERLDRVLKTAGLRLVIYLEDIDRNMGPQQYVNEICALCDRLRELENVSFVLAVGDDFGKKGELERIAEYNEVLPDLALPRQAVWEVIDGLFRKH